MSTGDIRVLGLVMSTHVLEDIGMDIPHGVIVTIPGEKALVSKDLHRAISSKCIAQIPSAAPPAPVQRTVTDELLIVRIQTLEERNRALEAENRHLQQALQAALAQQNGKLDAILSAIQSGAVVQMVQANGVSVAGQAGQAHSEVADGTAPQFIPSEIKPKDAETRIEVQKDEAGVSAVTGARERLRKLRNGGL